MQVIFSNIPHTIKYFWYPWWYRDGGNHLPGSCKTLSRAMSRFSNGIVNIHDFSVTYITPTSWDFSTFRCVGYIVPSVIVHFKHMFQMPNLHWCHFWGVRKQRRHLSVSRVCYNVSVKCSFFFFFLNVSKIGLDSTKSVRKSMKGEQFLLLEDHRR